MWEGFPTRLWKRSMRKWMLEPGTRRGLRTDGAGPKMAARGVSGSRRSSALRLGMTMAACLAVLQLIGTLRGNMEGYTSTSQESLKDGLEAWEEVSGNQLIESSSSKCVMRWTLSGPRGCRKSVTNSDEGFCAVIDEKQGRKFRVMTGHPDGLRQSRFRCADYAIDFANFKIHVNQHVEKIKAMPRPTTNPEPGFTRGIIMSAHMGVLTSAATSIRQLRQTGCHMPIEIFHLPGELSQEHPLVQEILNFGNVELREIEDGMYTRYYTKIYGILHSRFDNVLLLDSDNIVSRDPSFLFETEEFNRTGAIFWPDHWHPDHSPLFNFDLTSLAWELFDTKPVKMFELEAGQLMMNRMQNYQPLELMQTYVKHARIIEELQVVWGDKDLFRFSFLRMKQDFHMIQTPPAVAGFFLLRRFFCGQCLVQHDPKGGVVFFHRNSRKIGSFLGMGNRHTWSFMQRWTGSDVRDYRAIGSFHWFGTCWRLGGNNIQLTDISDTYGTIETDSVVNYASEIEKKYGMSSYRHS